MFGEGGEGFVVALRDLAGVGELEGMGRTLNPWIKISRSVFFFMTALGGVTLFQDSGRICEGRSVSLADCGVAALGDVRCSGAEDYCSVSANHRQYNSKTTISPYCL